MDDMKLKLSQSVAARLGAAPNSKEKDELIEELSDNLYRRFLEMNGAGVPEDEAFARAMDDLGDVDELLAYLGVEPAVGPDVVINSGDSRTQTKTENGQTRITTQGGQTVTISNPDCDPIAASTGTGEAPPQGEPEQQGGAHHSYRYGADGQSSAQNDLDAILANVSEVCNLAIDQAKNAIKQAKEALQRRTTVEKDSGHVRVHFNAGPDDPTPPAPPEPPAPPQPEPPQPPEPPTPPEGTGWEFEAELDSDAGRFFAGAGPKERKDVVYGFGYDKAKGGFFAQWGEYQGNHGGEGPHFSGHDAGMSANDDGSYSVTALKDLRGIEVVTTAGDVAIHVSEAPDAGVIIDGDVDDLDVTCSADGVLTIREGRTASSSFFSRRGFCSADVELFLPRRHWDMISVTTASGDVDIDRDGLDIDHLTVTTASGSLSARLNYCRVLSFKSASGDLEVKGPCGSLIAETMSGDLTLGTDLEDASLHTASGDIELNGPVRRLRAKAISGDLRVSTPVLPEVLELSSKSGDCEALLPDAGPFLLRMKTTSGEFDSAFPMNYINGTFVYGGGDGPCYSITTISGDVSLGRH